MTAIMTLENVVHFYNTKTKKIQGITSLSSSHYDKEMVIRENREMAFTPDLKYLVTPSIDES